MWTDNQIDNTADSSRWLPKVELVGGCSFVESLQILQRIIRLWVDSDQFEAEKVEFFSLSTTLNSMYQSKNDEQFSLFAVNLHVCG